jgi:hypothetical protein
MSFDTPQPGDYACVQIRHITKTIFGRRIKLPNLMGYLIRLFTLSKYDHCFIYIGKGEVLGAAPGKLGVHIVPLADYADCLTQWGTTPTTFAQRNAVLVAAIRKLGTPYGVLDIIYLGLSIWGFRPAWLLSQVLREDRMICSQFVAYCGETAKIDAWMCGQPFAQIVTPELLAKLAQGYKFEG